VTWRVLHSDCIEAMRARDAESIDAIVTDPPYELGFMAKKWDASGIAYSLDLWREALRVLKPGGHLAAFGGTRTYHRMACAIEDAGFEIRDSLHWLYGSGFPKSLNVSKAIGAHLGAERPEIGWRAVSRILAGSGDMVGGGVRAGTIPATEATSKSVPCRFHAPHQAAHASPMAPLPGNTSTMSSPGSAPRSEKIHQPNR
jgi:site-specific DNA-methyltransferase (adenine-specific)